MSYTMHAAQAENTPELAIAQPAAAPSSVFAERGVSVPRETVVMHLFRHFAAGFDGWKYLAGKYPNRVNLGKMSNERRVYALLKVLTDDELVLEFASLFKPTPAYLEAAGICEEVAMEVYEGLSDEKALAYLSSKQILPAAFHVLADRWWNRRRY